MAIRHESSPMVLKAKCLSIEAIKFVSSQPRGLESDVIMRQLVRSATSVGANSRAALRARSNAEMIAKLGIVEEEADECMFWLEILVETGLSQQLAVSELNNLAEGVLKMTVSAIRTLKSNSKNLVRESQAEYGGPSSFEGSKPRDDSIYGLDPAEEIVPLSALHSPL